MNVDVKGNGERYIVLNGKQYFMQEVGVDLYRSILDHREDLSNAQLYTKEQFDRMVELVLACYGGCIPTEEVLKMPVEDLMMEFALIEVHLRKRLDKRLEQFKANFTRGE